MSRRFRISPVHAVLYAFAVVGIAVASLGFSSPHQHPAIAPAPAAAPLLLTGSAGPSCPLSVKQQVDAVKAFGEMMPVFRHPRCINCHGGLDPMSDRHPGKDQIEGITDRDSLLEKCQDCHDGLKGWRVPGAPVFFVSKSDEELCLQMKRFEPTADGFVSHIHDDHGDIQFIAAGFVGDRALGEGLADYHLEIAKPPGTQADLEAKARKWAAAMGGEYVGSPECGCVLPKVKLSIKHESMYNENHAAYKAGWIGFHGIASFQVDLLPVEGVEGAYRGEATLVRSMQAQIANRHCTGTASQAEHWWFNATVDSTSNTMKLSFGFLPSDKQGSEECKIGGYVLHYPLDPSLIHNLREIVLPADDGAAKEETLQDPDGRATEWMLVKVVAVPGK